jgi:hypothetical protein
MLRGDRDAVGDKVGEEGGLKGVIMGLVNDPLIVVFVKPRLAGFREVAVRVMGIFESERGGRGEMLGRGSVGEGRRLEWNRGRTIKSGKVKRGVGTKRHRMRGERSFCFQFLCFIFDWVIIIMVIIIVDIAINGGLLMVGLEVLLLLVLLEACSFACGGGKERGTIGRRRMG